ncbi:MAG: hypothetical protein HQL10_12525 [Nitrospirae bacterium]|nr:hypothetical protein [Nitrospirota bacterium]
MKRILFRADAKPSIGTGDLVSLIRLSKYFEVRGWESHFMIRNYKAGCLLVQKHGLENIATIDENISVEEEVELINSYSEAWRINVIFLEITERSLLNYKNLAPGIIKATVCFDGQVFDDTALVVNWDVDAPKLFDRKRYPKTQLLLGTEYVILPIEFDFERIKNRAQNACPKKLLVAMGGADEWNLTQKVIQALIDYDVDFIVTVVLGAGYNYREALEQVVKKGGQRFKLIFNIENMFDEYMSCDVAIAAGGLTAYELIATRTPAILIAAYEHQIARCSYFHEQGLARYLGFREVVPEMLINSVMNPLLPDKEYIVRTKEIVDAVCELAK